MRIVRQEYIAAKQPTVSKFFRSIASKSPEQLASEQLTTHRSAVTLYLNTRLAAVGKEQRDQQELRVKRALDRSAQTGGLSASTFGMDLLGVDQAEAHKRSKGKAKEIPSIFTPKPSHAEDEEDEVALTSKQIQQFELEASTLLKESQDQLKAIKKAESSLLEISALQSELVHHLTQQTELTDQLWEDAVFVTGRVEEGNKQLVKARERNKDSRLFLLVFLVGASLTLLFVSVFDL